MKSLILSARDVQRVVRHVGLNAIMDEMIDSLTAAFASYDAERFETPVREGECQVLTPDLIGPSLPDLARDPAAFEFARDRVTVFDSTGWALEDHVSFALLLRHASALGLGTHVEIECTPPDPKNPYSILETGPGLENREVSLPGRSESR